MQYEATKWIKMAICITEESIDPSKSKSFANYLSKKFPSIQLIATLKNNDSIIFEDFRELSEYDNEGDERIVALKISCFQKNGDYLRDEVLTVIFDSGFIDSLWFSFHPVSGKYVIKSSSTKETKVLESELKTELGKMKADVLESMLLHCGYHLFIPILAAIPLIVLNSSIPEPFIKVFAWVILILVLLIPIRKLFLSNLDIDIGGYKRMVSLRRSTRNFFLGSVLLCSIGIPLVMQYFTK